MKRLFLLLLICNGYAFAQDQLPPGLKGRVKKCTEYDIDTRTGDREIGNIDEYDTSMLLRKRTVQYGGQFQFVVDYAYDSARRLIYQKRTRPVKGVDSEYSWEYDANGKLVKYIEDNKDDTAYNSIFIYSYNKEGKQVRCDTRTLDNRYKSHSVYTYKGDTAFYTFYENGHPQDAKIRVYDSLGRQVELIVKASHTSSYVLMRYVYTYNAAGREIKRMAYDNDGFHHQIDYEYDPEGHQLKWVFRNLAGTEVHTNEYTFDKTGNIVKEVKRLDGVIKYINEYVYEYFD